MKPKYKMRLAVDLPLPVNWMTALARTYHPPGAQRRRGVSGSPAGCAGEDARGSPGAASTVLSSQVHIANQCEVGGLRLAAAGTEGVRAPGTLDAAAPALPGLPAVLDPDAPAPAKPGGPGRPRDPNMCFFEGQQRPHGARWAPNYDPLCSLCTCQVGGPGRAHWGRGLGQGALAPLSTPPPLPAETHGDL